MSLVGVCVLLLIAWFSPDGRILIGVALVAGIVSGVYALRLVLAPIPRWARIVGVIGCCISLLTVSWASLDLSGNWDYFRGRASMTSERYEGAVDCYGRAIEQIDASGPMVVGAPFRVRLSTRGLVRDRRVEMFSDLGYIAYSGHDLATSRGWYSLALRTAESEGYDDVVVRDIETALSRIDGEE